MGVLEALDERRETVHVRALDEVRRAQHLGRVAWAPADALSRQEAERLVERPGLLLAIGLLLGAREDVIPAARSRRLVALAGLSRLDAAQRSRGLDAAQRSQGLRAAQRSRGLGAVLGWRRLGGRLLRQGRRVYAEGQLDRAANSVERGRQLAAPLADRALRRFLVWKPCAEANRQQVAAVHQGLDDLLVMPEGVRRDWSLLRGRADGGQAFAGDLAKRSDVRQRRAGMIDDRVHLDHSASPIFGSAPFSSAVATELMSARSPT